ncbi:MAG: hypothetical protein R3D51_10430 [Hyphomicrobiaceae bacterium]
MTREGEAQATNTGTANSAAADDAALMREMRLQRNLKIIIAVMTLFIVAGLGAIVARIVSGASKHVAPAATISRPGVSAGPSITLELPQGAKIVSVSLSGNRLAVHHEGPRGSGITILDLETGARIADVTAREALPNAQ